MSILRRCAENAKTTKGAFLAYEVGMIILELGNENYSIAGGMLTMKKCVLALLLLIFTASFAYAGVLEDLKTSFENSAPTYGAASLPRVPEIVDFVKTVANNSGGRVRYETMGYTVLGTPQPMAIIGYPKAPKNATEIGNRVVIWFLGSMHGGEAEGMEGQLWFMREVALGKHDDRLKNVVVIINPAFNPDGRNSGTTGQRDNALGIDLNRDFSKMDNLEIKYLYKHMRKWQPHIFIDQHLAGQGHRHLMMYGIGKSTINDWEVHTANQNFADSIFAKPSSIAICPSWPQACITQL
jgi:hypothetical protein